MSKKAFISAAAASALAFTATAAFAGKSDSIRAMDMSMHAMNAMHASAEPNVLEVIASEPTYYALAPSATSFESPDIYASASPPEAFYAEVAAPMRTDATQFAFVDPILDENYNEAAITQFASIDSLLDDEFAVTADTFDASATVDSFVFEPQAVDTAGFEPAIVEIVTSNPVPDTPQNRATFGGPESRAGRLTAPVGN